MSSFEKVLLAFIGGAAVGLTIGLLLAPEKGAETRKKISGKIKHLSTEMEEKLTSLQDCAETIIEKISDLVQPSTTVADENNKTTV
jgi:gas vesicle protein